mgnify:FL=1
MIPPISRRTFLQGLGTTLVTGSLTACTINASRNPTGLTEAALAVTPIIDPKTLEKPNLLFLKDF